MHRKESNYKGSISIFLLLTLGVLLSLILGLIEHARMNAIRMQIECVTDMGLNSVFAEYHRELLNQYDLFFIDTSYGSNTNSLHHTENHLQDYMSYNFQVNKGFIGNHAKDWLAIEANKILISEPSFATDDNGNVLKRQALEYMKNKTGIYHIENVLNQIDVVNQHQFLTRNIDAENAEVKLTLDHLETEENGKKKKVHLNSPANRINAMRGSGILNLTVGNVAEISTQAVSFEQSIENRTLNRGIGILPGKELQENRYEEFLFGEYLLEKCGDYTKKNENSVLQYELEYILFGRGCDRDNLSAVANKLLLIRQVSNNLYLWSDTTKREEADAMALAIASAVCLPEIQPIVKMSIMFAWAYAESVGDVKILLDGGKIPLLKNSSTWRLQLEHLENFESRSVGKEDGKEGLTYRDYIRILLIFMNKEEKLNHFMNLIEMNMKRTEGNRNFKLDACIDQMMVDIECKSKFGYTYQIKRKYSYE